MTVGEIPDSGPDGDVGRALRPGRAALPVAGSMAVAADPALSRQDWGAAQAYLDRPIPGAMSGARVDGFLVDPDLARVSIGRLDEAIGELSRMLVGFTTGVWFPPPGRDEVSMRLAENATRMAGRAEMFTVAWQEQIQAARDALAAQLAAYETADREALR